MWLFEDSLENFILFRVGLELQAAGEILPQAQKVLQGTQAERTEFLTELAQFEEEMSSEATRQLKLLLQAIRQWVETQGQNTTGGKELTGYYAMAWQQLLTGKPLNQNR